eukprot:5605699-Prymnesium_polylepis.1
MQRASAGMRKPRVFPEPVFAIARTSRPAAARGHAAACTADGPWKGWAPRTPTSAFGNGAFSKERHGSGAVGSWIVISCSVRNAFASACEALPSCDSRSSPMP